MCTFCGYTTCPPHCPAYVYPVPCNPCVQETGCKVHVPAQCVTINNTTLDVFLNCTNLLNYIYNCIVADPVQYAKFCSLWAACDGQATCAAPTNISIGAIDTTSAVVTWTTVPTVTYDVYVDNILRQAGASSPLTLSGLSASTSYTVKVVSTCTNAETNFATAVFSTTGIANLVFTWNRTSGETFDLTSSINGTFTSIDWGDGVINTSLSHQYTSTGSFIVRIYGSTATSIVLGTSFGPAVYNVTAVSALPSTTVSLTVPRSNLSSLPSLAPMTNLQTLNIYKNSITSLSLSSNTLLHTLNAQENSLTGTFALGSKAALTYVHLGSNAITNVTGVSTCPLINYFNVSADTLPASVINTALGALDTNGVLNGTFDSLSQTPSAAPTGAGATAKTALIGKGWTVTTD